MRWFGGWVEVVEGDLRGAVEADRDDGGAETDGGVSVHGGVGPGTGAEVAGEALVEGDGDGAGEADLATVGVSAEHEVEAGVGGLAVDLGGVGEEDGDGVSRDVGGGVVDVVGAVVVGVVDAGEVEVLVAASDGDGLIEEHGDTHGFDGGEHADAVVIAKDGEDWAVEVAADLSEGVKRCDEGTEGLSAEVAGKDAEVVLEGGEEFDETPHGTGVHVGVEVGEVEDGEAVEERWQAGEEDVVVTDLDAGGVVVAAAVETGELEQEAQGGVGGVPVFGMEEVEALAEDGFVIVLDTEALTGVDATQTLLELLNEVVLHNGHDSTRLGGGVM